MRYRVMKPYKHKKSSNPWFRRVVPADLRDIVGKREIKQSLGTISHADAVGQIAKLDAQWTAYFTRLRRERIIDERHLAVEYCDAFFSNIRSKGIERADRAILIMLRMIADAMVLAWGRRAVIETGADCILDYALDDDELLEEESAEADLIPEADRAHLAARLRVASVNPSTFGAAFREVIAYAVKQERWHWFAFPVTMVEDAADVTITPTGPLYGLVAAEMACRLIDYRSPRWDEKLLQSLGFLAKVGGLQEEISAAAPEPVEVPGNFTPAKVPAAGQGKRLSDAFAKWEKLATPKPSAVIEATRCRLRFVNLFGDLPLEAISKSTINSYRDWLMDLPKGTQIEKLNAAGVKLSDFIESAKLAESEGRIDKSLRVLKIKYDRLHATTIKKDIGALSAVFGIAKNEDWMVGNPCNSVTIANYSKSRRGQRVRRKPLTKAMLAKMFDTPSFTGCSALSGQGRYDPGLTIFQDPLYWVLLFGTTNGTRLEELGQVNLEDIGFGYDTNGSIFTFIRITEEGDGQTVKTDDSERCIIVHPQLIRLGFNNYVERRRAAGATTLFDLERKGKRQAMTQSLSQKVNRYIDRYVTDDKRYVWYSTRHAFIDRSIWVPETIARQMVGHSSGRQYGDGLPSEELASAFAGLDLSFIDWDGMVEAVRTAKAHGLLI